MRGRVVIASIVLSLLVAASSTVAQQPKQDEASPLLAQAAALARAGKFAEAAPLAERAHSARATGM